MPERGDLRQFADFAGRLADASRALINDAQWSRIRGQVKGDGSPVTEVDQAVEDRLREMIAAAYPEHGVLGEERGATAIERDFVWTLDPVDGTLSYLAGIPAYGTLIGLLHRGAPILGVIDLPATGERWLAHDGLSTLRNGMPVSARACEDLASALLSTSGPEYLDAADRPAVERLKAATRWCTYGGNCVTYAQIACGRIDIGIDAAMGPYDYLPLVPIVSGAGGVITDWQGAPLVLGSGDKVLAGGDARLHAKALEVLAGD